MEENFFRGHSIRIKPVPRRSRDANVAQKHFPGSFASGHVRRKRIQAAEVTVTKRWCSLSRWRGPDFIVRSTVSGSYRCLFLLLLTCSHNVCDHVASNPPLLPSRCIESLNVLRSRCRSKPHLFKPSPLQSSAFHSR